MYAATAAADALLSVLLHIIDVFIDCIVCMCVCVCAPLNVHHILTVGLVTLQIVCKYDFLFRTDPNHTRSFGTVSLFAEMQWQSSKAAKHIFRTLS